MNFTLQPSVEQSALIKIAISLVSHQDAEFRFRRYVFWRELWKAERDTFLEENGQNVDELHFPVKIKEKLLIIMREIKWEMRCWMLYVGKNFDLPYNYPITSIIWTSYGTIDKQKTAELLVKDDNLHIYDRYRLACTFCLEKFINYLWRKMIKYSDTECLLKATLKEPCLVSFWTYVNMGKISQLRDISLLYCRQRVSPYEFAFHIAVADRNEVATRYFIQKLNPIRNGILLNKAAILASSRVFFLPYPCSHSATDVLCLLISSMDEEEQMNLFCMYSRNILESLLVWPWQDLFMETAYHMWPFISEKDFYIVVNSISHRNKSTWVYFYFRKIFETLWDQISRKHKKYFIYKLLKNYEIPRFTLKYILEKNPSETIKVILAGVAPTRKREFIFCKRGRQIMRCLISLGQFDMIELFIRQCITTKTGILKFKKTFKKRKAKHFGKKNENCKKFLRILDSICYEFV